MIPRENADRTLIDSFSLSRQDASYRVIGHFFADLVSGAFASRLRTRCDPPNRSRFLPDDSPEKRLPRSTINMSPATGDAIALECVRGNRRMSAAFFRAWRVTLPR
jgi:hypothetical protein